MDFASQMKLTKLSKPITRKIEIMIYVHAILIQISSLKTRELEDSWKNQT